MSTYCDLYCRTCKTEAGFHWNRGQSDLLVLWQHRASFVELGKLRSPITAIDNTLPPHVSVEFYIRFQGPESGGEEFPEFAAEHHDHDVVVRDEYARYSDDCGKDCVKDYGGGQMLGRACTMKIGHDGDCSYHEQGER